METESGIDNLEDHMSNLLEHFLVFKATICQPDLNCSLVVARQSCSTIDPQRLVNVVRAIINALYTQGIEVISVCSDGASENHENHY